MPRKRIYTVLLIAMTVGAMFAIGTYRYVQAKPATAPATVNTSMVVVWASNMDVGTALRAEDLRAIEWPSGSMPEGAGRCKGTNPVAPMAGTWMPWTLVNATEFRPAPPPAFDSEVTKSALNE